MKPSFQVILLYLFFCSWNTTFGQCPDTITLSTQSAVDSFQINYGHCSSFKWIQVRGDSITNLNGFLGVKQIRGNFLIRHNPQLVNLHGLDSLNYIDGRLIIWFNDLIRDLQGLGSLRKVEDNVEVVYNDSLRNIKGLDTLYHIQSFMVQHNHSQESMEGLESLAEGGVPFSLGIHSCINLTSLKGLESLTRVWSLWLSNNHQLSNLDELSNLFATNSIRLDDNRNLVDISGLKNVNESFAGLNVNILENPRLKSLHGLEKLVDIESLTVFDNDSLINLEGLNNIKRITRNEGVRIEGNQRLQNIEALRGVEYIPGDVKILRNPLLDLCDLPFVCEHAQYSTDVNDFTENGPPCNSASAIITSCQFEGGFAGGLVFLDMNCDQAYDTTDILLPNYLLEDVQTKVPLSATSPDGIYFRHLHFSDSVTLQPRPINHFTTHPSFHTIVTDSSSLNLDTLDFAICPDTLFHDVAVTLSNYSYLRPGFLSMYQVCVENIGTYFEDVTLVLDFSNFTSSGFVEIDTSEIQGSVNGQTITWQLQDISMFNPVCFDVIIRLENFTAIGQTIYAKASVIPNDTIIENPLNNEVVLAQEVVGSYDPNDKTVNTSRISPWSKETPLEYQIRFQNTGNFPATFVEVIDTLPPGVKIQTFRMLAASHPYTLSFPDSNVLRWRFENIQLPDSLSNEPESHGFVRFAIHSAAALPPQMLISNKAGIYFDFNPPVITNPAETLVEMISHIEESRSSFDFTLFPNPTSEIAFIEFFLEQPTDLSLQITNLDGKIMKTETYTSLLSGSNVIPISFDNFPGGIYVVKASINQQQGVKKVICLR